MTLGVRLRGAAVGAACLATAASLTVCLAPGAASADATAGEPAATAAKWKYRYNAARAGNGWVCAGSIDQRWKTRGNDYVRARMGAPTWGVSCSGWLEIRKGKGKFKRVSRVYYYNPGQPNKSTGWHKSFGKYQGRVCVMDDVFIKKCSRAV
jgi:hypothetical protein